MTKEEIELWNRKEKEEYEFLDSIDVRKFLIHNKEVYECMIAIKDAYNKNYCEKYNDDYGLFNYTGESDFIDYIHKRYPDISSNESIRYYIWNPNDRGKKK